MIAWTCCHRLVAISMRDQIDLQLTHACTFALRRHTSNQHSCRTVYGQELLHTITLFHLKSHGSHCTHTLAAHEIKLYTPQSCTEKCCGTLRSISQFSTLPRRLCHATLPVHQTNGAGRFGAVAWRLLLLPWTPPSSRPVRGSGAGPAAQSGTILRRSYSTS